MRRPGGVARQQVGLKLPCELVARVDERVALIGGGVSRTEYVEFALEKALADVGEHSPDIHVDEPGNVDSPALVSSDGTGGLSRVLSPAEMRARRLAAGVISAGSE